MSRFAVLASAAVLLSATALLAGHRSAPRVAALPTCFAEVTGDAKVSALDLSQIAQRFGVAPGPPYNAAYDLNGDAKISSIDLFAAAVRFGPCPDVFVGLADLTPSQPATNGWGPYEEDASNGEDAAGDGGPLTINGVVFARGLGVHADSEIVFAAPAGCTQFAASVGIDDEIAPGAGSVTFEVWSGTRRLYQSPVKTAADDASAFNLALINVSSLRVVANMGADNAFDHADWADAYFLCRSSLDAVAPAISDVATTPSATSAVVTWTTNEIADTQVEYGVDASYGSTTQLDTDLGTEHQAVMGGLTPGITYHYRVISRDPFGNLSQSDDATFVTDAAALLGDPAPFAAGTNAHGIAMGDVNNDGDLDIVTANAGADTISSLLGNGDGMFDAPTSRSTGSQPKSVVLGYLNADNMLDAVTANQGSSTVSVLLGNASGTFNTKVDYAACTNAHEATLALINADAFLDIACVGWGASSARVLLGAGNGTFGSAATFAVGLAPHSVAAADYNNDGKIDLATANHDSNTISVLIGNGAGAFAPQVTYAAGLLPHSIRAAYLNDDDDMDLVSANNGGDTVTVLINDGDGTFAPQVMYATGNTPKGVALADIDDDGFVDILTANIDDNYPSLVNPGGDTISVLRGNGDGTFQRREDFDVGQAPFAVGVGDINDDARLDVATANWWDHGITVRLGNAP